MVMGEAQDPKGATFRSLTIASYSPAAVQATKRLAMFSRRTSEAERFEIEAVRAMVEARDDYKEGAAAFSGRR